MSQTSQFERERAKRLYAAVMSSRLGTTLMSEYRRIGDHKISRWWYHQAERLDRELSESAATAISSPLKEAIH